MKCKVKLTMSFIMELPDDITDPHFFIEEHLCGASLLQEANTFFEEYRNKSNTGGCLCVFIDRKLINFHKSQ